MPETTMPPFSVLIIDAHTVDARGLRAILSGDARFGTIHVVVSAGALSALRTNLNPTLIVLDPQKGDRLDLQLIRDLAAAAPASRICVYTNYYEEHALLDALRAGALAYLLKDGLSGESLLDPLAAVARTGGGYTDPEVVRRFRQSAAAKLSLPTPAPGTPQPAGRALDVLRLLVEGASNGETARHLTISERTVQDEIGHLMAVLHVKNRVQLAVLAVQQGLV